MATLTFEIGELKSSNVMDDEQADSLLRAAFDLHQSNEDLAEKEFGKQDKLDWVVQKLIPQMLTQIARQYVERIAVERALSEFEDKKVIPI